MTTLPAWVEAYRGKGFRRGASGPDSFDCYGLVRAVLGDQWGALTPSLDGAWHLDASERIDRALTDPDCPWAPWTGEPAVGDVVTFIAPGTASELHVGIVVAPGWMLHARQGRGVETARLDRLPWCALRFGPAYRHRSLA
jgi:cell wall-associated NlpC family hydrolase